MTAKLAGLCLITLGVINVLHEIVLRSRDHYEPGLVNTVVTAIMFTAGVALLVRPMMTKGRQ